MEVKNYCEYNGIEIPSEEAAKHRLPFILSILEICDIIETNRSEFKINTILLFKDLFDTDKTYNIDKIINALYYKNTDKLNEEEIDYLKENFGVDFLTNKYFTDKFYIIKE